MRKTLAAAVLAVASLFAWAAPAAAQNNYFLLSYDTTRGTAAMTLAGDFRVANSSLTPTTYIFRVNGWQGLTVSTRSVFTSSASFLATGDAQYSVFLASGLYMNGGGVRYADGTLQYTATPPGVALVNGTNTWTGTNEWRGASSFTGTAPSLTATGAEFGAAATRATFTATGQLSAQSGETVGTGLRLRRTAANSSSVGLLDLWHDNTGALNGWSMSVDLTKAMRWENNGNVIVPTGNLGIGTTLPGSKLHVSSGALNLVGTGAGIFINSGITETDRAPISWGVTGYGAPAGAGSTSSGDKMTFYDNGSLKYVYGLGPTAAWSQVAGGTSGNGFLWYRDTTVNMALLEAGLGIGTASPLAKLSVVGDSSFSQPATFLSSVTVTSSNVSLTAINSQAGAANNNLTGSGLIVGGDATLAERMAIRVKNYTGIGGGGYVGQLVSRGNANVEIFSTDAAPLIFGTNATERIRIHETSGNLGVNDASADARVDIVAAAADQYGLIVSSPSDAAAGYQLWVDKYGNVGSTTQPAARWLRTTAQTVSNTVNTALTFPIKEYSTQSMFNVATATIPVGGEGYYRVNCTASFGNDANGRRAIWAAKNGTLITGCKMMTPPAAADETMISAQCMPYLLAGDAITCNVFHNAGGALDVNSGMIEVMKIW